MVGPTPYGLYKVKFEGGGELPDALKNSQWSTKKDAEFFAKEYNRSK